MSKLYIIAVASSRLFVRGSFIREHDKKNILFFTTEPDKAKSFIDDNTAKDYKSKLVSEKRRFIVEQFG